MTAAKTLFYFYSKRSKGLIYWESMSLDLSMTNLGEQNNVLDALVSKFVSSKECEKIVIRFY